MEDQTGGANGLRVLALFWQCSVNEHRTDPPRSWLADRDQWLAMSKQTPPTANSKSSTRAFERLVTQFSLGAAGKITVRAQGAIWDRAQRGRSAARRQWLRPSLNGVMPGVTILFAELRQPLATSRSSPRYPSQRRWEGHAVIGGRPGELEHLTAHLLGE